MSLLRSLLMLQSRLHVIGLNVQQWPFVDQPREGGGGGVRGGGGGGGGAQGGSWWLFQPSIAKESRVGMGAVVHAGG